MAEYREFKLISGSSPFAHHLLRLNSSKYDLKSLQPNVHLRRQQISQVQDDDMQIDGSTGVDPSKIAPGVNVVKTRQGVSVIAKKKSRTYFVGRDDEDYEEDGTFSQRKYTADPDKNPWILSNDSQSVEFEGRLEGSQNSNYVFFMFSEDGFKVIPCSKWYKFFQKMNHQKLTLEEAEERLANLAKSKVSDRWMMKRLKKEDENETVARLKVIGKSKIKEKDLINDLDFEDEFQDDEGLFELGIEDEEESKEAYQRTTTGKFSFEDLEESKPSIETSEDLKKTLKKFEKNNIVFDSEEENPYVSSAEEEEEVKTEGEISLNNNGLFGFKKKKDDLLLEMKEGSASPSQPLKSSSPAALLEALKQGKKSSSRVASTMKREGSFSPMRERSMSPMADARAGSQSPQQIATTKIKLRVGSMPGPSTEGQDLKRKREEEALADMKKIKPYSPQPATSPAYSIGTPAMSPTSEDESNLLNESDVLAILRAVGPISVRDLIGKLKEKFKMGPKNQERIRQILKKIVVHRKEKGVVELKEEYK